VENEPSQVSTGTGEWPAVPPAPAPVKPPAPALGPEPPIINTDVRLIPPAPAAAASEPGDDSPTGSIPVDPLPSVRPIRPAARPRVAAARRVPAASTEESPLTTLQRTVRRQQAVGRDPRREVVWQPRFAYTSAAFILLALLVVSMPLWIVLWREIGVTGQPVSDIIAICMMLLGGFITGAAAWIIILEMRGRIRMVDTLVRSGGDVIAAPAAPEIPALDTPMDHLTVAPLNPLGIPSLGGWEPGTPPPPISARVEAQQVSAAATLEASSRLLTSFSAVLKSFGQLWAQVAMLTVALALFVGATFLSLH
jgi:hypothetical protein